MIGVENSCVLCGFTEDIILACSAEEMIQKA